MAGRREVNVDRPEHSWIPFYRELAEKLVDLEENWRGRQDELVELMREMALDADLGVPEGVARSQDPFMDPFSIFATFNNSSKGEKRLLTIQKIRNFFEIDAKILHTDYYVPEVYSGQMMYFNGVSGYENAVQIHWDTFECIRVSNPFDSISDKNEMIKLINASLAVTNVKMPKLSSALYWINPENFLRYDTINGRLGETAVNDEDYAENYLDGLARVREIDERPFPEINDEIYLRSHESVAPPRIWMVRGGRQQHAVSEFLSSGRVGIGFSLGGVDLSGIKSRREIRRMYAEQNEGADSRQVGQNASQVASFVLDMKIGDFVIMPEQDRLRLGAVTSRPYREVDRSYENSRRVDWYEDTIQQIKPGALPPRRTVSKITGEVEVAILKETGRSTDKNSLQMPEDSWVPFHLEVADKLMEGEWWLTEKREALDDMIEKVRWSDPDEVSDDYEHIRWTPDPYSFYLSFNMRTDGTKRLPGYRKVQELLDVDANVPDTDHRVRGLGTHYRFTNAPGDDDIDALWDFFRFAVGFKPAEDEGAAEFVEKYDRVIEVNGFVGQWDITLSYWLYWIDPRKYLLTRRLHRQELGLAEELSLPEHISGGQQYLEALRATRSFAESKRMSLLDINRESTTREMLGLLPLTGTDSYTIDNVLDDGVFLERAELDRMVRILRSKKNLILQGPPGVGKTFIAKKLAYVLIGSESDERITSVQFHQSYSYEDFVGGFRPDIGKNGQLVFKPTDGPFLEVCETARVNDDQKYVVLIDEINRGNLSRVFGELLMLIESDKRELKHGVTLQHRPEHYHSFFVPKNVYIIGTMNLADKSLTGMNVAMRRRFGFYDLEPQFGEPVFKNWLSNTGMPPNLQNHINTKMSQLNTKISKDDSLDFNYAVGHSFFCPPENEQIGNWDEWYETVVDYEIRPLLREYWFDDPDRANQEADSLKNSG